MVESLQQGREKKKKNRSRGGRRGEGGAGEGKREAARTHHHLHRCQPNFFSSSFFFKGNFPPTSISFFKEVARPADTPQRPHPRACPLPEVYFSSSFFLPPPLRKRKEEKREIPAELRHAPALCEGARRPGSPAVLTPDFAGAGLLAPRHAGRMGRRGGAGARRGERAREGAANLFRKKESKWRFCGCAKFINSALTSRPPRLPGGERWARLGTPPRRAALRGRPRPLPAPALPRAP